MSSDSRTRGPGGNAGNASPWRTLKQAAEYLQLHPWTVRQRLKAGALRGHRLGRYWRIHIEELERFVKGDGAA